MFPFKALATRFPLMAWAGQQLDRIFTTGGKAVFIAFLLFAAGSTHLDSPVYYLCASTFSLLLVSLLVAQFYKPNLACDLQAPASATCEQQFPIRLFLHNRGSRGAFDLMFTALQGNDGDAVEFRGDAPGKVAVLESQKNDSVRLNLFCKRRGIHPLPGIRCRTSFPFNLVHVTEVISVDQQIISLPKFEPLLTFDFLPRRLAERDGEIANHLHRQQHDFVGSREYVPGIPTRRWDYAAWARIGKPHVCQFEDQVAHKASLVLNLDQSPDENAFEAAISLACSIASAMESRAFLIDRLIVGKHVFEFDHESTQPLHLITHHLAAIEFENVGPVRLPDALLQQVDYLLIVSTRPQEDCAILDAELQKLGVDFGWINVVNHSDEVSPQSGTQVTVEAIEQGCVRL